MSDLPDCLWCGELIPDDVARARIDRWYFHEGCSDALMTAVDDRYTEPPAGTLACMGCGQHEPLAAIGDHRCPGAPS
jgi:hypothetical protein